MKLLLAYDGSPCSEAALDDLSGAGLPGRGEAFVLTVAEVWLPPREAAEEVDPDVDPYIEEAVRKHREKGEKLLNEAEMMATHAAGRVRSVLPAWNVSSGASFGSPAWEILAKCEELHPDLIVVGSHGHTALGRMVLGSISQKVLSEAECSVRVARGRIEIDAGPARVAIGFDGSRGAQAALQAVASRQWPEGTEVCLMSAMDSIVPTAIGRFIPPVAEWVHEEVASENAWISTLMDKAAETLTAKGLTVSKRLVPGNPKQVLVREAQSWHADCIFVGANAFGSRVERFLLGSTSAAIAARAHCSVEIVRTRQPFSTNGN